MIEWKKEVIGVKKRMIAALLSVLLLLPLCACGARRDVEKSLPQETGQNEPGVTAAPAPEIVSTEASFPLLAAPFSDAQSEAMVNHNCRRCALMVENYFYCGCALSDGSRALVRFEVIDGGLYRPEVLRGGCGADYLTLWDGRLYYLGPGGRPESIALDGSDCRAELNETCLSLQPFGGALYCLLPDGTLLALRGGEREQLPIRCGWAFVSDAGVFYTAAADGRAHLYDPASRTDIVLTAAAAEGLTVIKQMLYFAADGALCALDLANGELLRSEYPLAAAPEFLWSYDYGWYARLRIGGETRLAPLGGLFGNVASFPAAEGSRVCRAVDGDLRTDELFDASGATVAFALVMPDGRDLRMNAERLG